MIHRAFGFSTLVFVIIHVCLWTTHLSWAHVALTYPPARSYDLDFLDNSRTKGPCGMPKGLFTSVVIMSIMKYYAYSAMSFIICLQLVIYVAQLRLLFH